MSIIEKAIEKLNKQEGRQQNNKTDDATDSSVERAAAKVQQASGQPQKAAPRQQDRKVSSVETQHSAKTRLDVEKLSAAGIVSPNENAPYIADEVRRIKRPLMSNAFGKNSALVANGNLVMVTSSLPGEGKSFTAVNLALSMALERDHTVLLVDADVTMSKITNMLDIKNRHGLIDYLYDDSIDLGDLIINMDFPRLSVLPAGVHHAQTAELLASDKMRNMVHEVATRYNDRIIVFDSPPLLATPESSILMTMMGQVVMVVEANRTPHSALKEALKLLDRNKPVGLVLNKAKRPPFYHHFGAYYGYKAPDK